LKADDMTTLHAEFSGFTAPEFQDLEHGASKSSGAANHAEARLDVSKSEPGEFYWHEDAPAVPLWQGCVVALRHMLGMKI
jgi:hypothetical protein